MTEINHCVNQHFVFSQPHIHSITAPLGHSNSKLIKSTFPEESAPANAGALYAAVWRANQFSGPVEQWAQRAQPA